MRFISSFFLAAVVLTGSIASVTAASCPGFRTQTQGGWGSVPNGNNPGSFLHANFNAVFPQGLSVGCTNQLKLTTAQAVTDFLPSGSTASALPNGTLVNPGGSYNNVFAGQVVALAVSLGFDNAIPSFGSSSTNLKNLVIANGTFAGWTVQQLFNEANKKLGGCVSPYSFSQLNNAVSSVNENYVDGNVSGNFLSCPTTIIPPSVSVSVGNVACNGAANGYVNITVSGGTAPYSFAWSNGKTTEDLSNVSAGSYSVTVTSANGATATASTTVSQPNAIAVNVASTNPSCSNEWNGAIALGISGGTSPYAVMWSGGYDGASINGLVAGQYCYTITDAHGCTANGCVTLSEPSELLAYMDCSCASGLLCYGDCSGHINLTVVGGVAPFAYAWSNGATTEDVSNLCADFYSVTVTDANGCTFDASHAPIEQAPPVTINVVVSDDTNPNDGVCDGYAYIQMSEQDYFNGIEWSNGFTDMYNFNLCPGEYCVTVTTPNGCAGSTCVTMGSGGNQRLATDNAAVTDFHANVYPNPNNGTFAMHVTADKMGTVTLQAFDMMGREVMQNVISVNAGANDFAVTMPDAAAGTYNLVIGNGKTTIKQFVTIQK